MMTVAILEYTNLNTSFTDAASSGPMPSPGIRVTV